MNHRRTGTLFLALLMCASVLLCGCSNQDSSEKKNESPQTQQMRRDKEGGD